VLSVVAAIGKLRRRKLFWAIRWATVTVGKWEDCRIIHASVQGTHVHLIVEAADKRALARGMKAFEISAAKHINAVLGRRRGLVFADRYHLEVITSPRQARRALAYVLNNWRKHREDAGRSCNVDPFSSGWSFNGWKQRAGEVLLWKPPETYLAMVTWYPKTWLLTTGWRQHGLIDFHEIPSSRSARCRGRGTSAPTA
jgi:putative transposase